MMQIDPLNTAGGEQDALWFEAQSWPLKYVPGGQIGVAIGLATHHFPAR
jgi:hypothetical protein